ncbi:antA/AntB antirepressor family protein [Mesorhizobium sp.]|uniref:antA/AntB antirepressor family protein n=1 Tax=Mesorhizobium sp. TaxID=1871066 RepID=UPI0025C0F718|nr:antA/AntB antirepressor family protein [Mesorhizobium sp.]
MQEQRFPAITVGSIGAAAVQTVNARDLHAFLNSRKVFGAWINDRIEQYGFIENADFVVFSQTGNNPQGGRPMKEYALSIDMAKQLSMVERNEQGQRARLYFLECERRAKAPSSVDLNDPATLRGLLASYADKALELQKEVDQLRPSQIALERISMADGSLCITDAAKALQMQPKEFFARLQRNGWIFKRRGSDHYLGYESKVMAGYLEHKVTAVPRGDGSEKMVEQVRITPKGLTKIASLISRH